MLNTHWYDGKLNFYENTNFSKNIDKYDKEKLKIDILNFYEPLLTHKAFNFYKQIAESFGTQENYDSSNNIWVDDIIYCLWQIRHQDNMLQMLDEQLCDMETGFCPQGRSTRLYQILLTYSF